MGNDTGQEKVVTWLDGKILFVDIYATQPNWMQCRVVLTYGGIWLMYGTEKKGIPLTSIGSFGREIPKKQLGNVSDYVSVTYVSEGKETTIAITGISSQLKKLKKYLMFLKLHQKPVYILHPAKIGGVIQDNIQWDQGILNVSWTPGGAADKLVIQRRSGNVEIPLNNIELVQTENQNIGGKSQNIINIKYSYENNAYNTFILAEIQNLLVEYINDHLQEQGVISRHTSDTISGPSTGAGLDETDEEILVAIYSGVSSLEVPSFMEGVDVDQVESIYDKLISYGLVELVRLRKDVQLTPKGRNIVNKKMQT
ncbi:MAG: CheF family chemotaxis protein [Euryarchaeota archaeon]|nr:CheF family chemotaxis protein [Euryarchaeota archaeon]